jgi:hypothetical protein
LEGFTWSQFESDSEWCWRDGRARAVNTLPDYNTYDAIVPLVRKWCDDWDFTTDEPCRWDKFVETLWSVLGIDSDYTEQEAWKVLFKCPVSQLREALLRATGRWQEE